MKKMEIQTVQKRTTATCSTERSIIFGAVLVLFTCTLIIVNEHEIHRCVGRVKHGRFEGRKCSESYDTVLREAGKDKADFWCSGDICDVSANEEQCYCFSLCSDLPATEFWNATREVDIADPSSP
eukprot:SAG31_NODE_16775_length_696_cov_2.896147_1_plen_124_part_10